MDLFVLFEICIPTAYELKLVIFENSKSRINSLPYHGKFNFAYEQYLLGFKKPRHAIKEFFENRFSKYTFLPPNFAMEGEYVFFKPTR